MSFQALQKAQATIASERDACNAAPDTGPIRIGFRYSRIRYAAIYPFEATYLTILISYRFVPISTRPTVLFVCWLDARSS